MSIQGALAGATNQIIGASISANKRKASEQERASKEAQALADKETKAQQEAEQKKMKRDLSENHKIIKKKRMEDAKKKADAEKEQAQYEEYDALWTSLGVQEAGQSLMPSSVQKADAVQERLREIGRARVRQAMMKQFKFEQWRDE